MQTYRWRAMARLLLLTIAVSGCSPSLQYQSGRGFYSDDLVKSQLQDAMAAGKVRNLGRFSVEAGGCFNYTEDRTDRNIVFPAIKQKLTEMGANAADNVAVKEKWYDFMLGLLIIPGFLGCNNWEISGEALQVDKTALKGPTGLRDDGPIWVRFSRGIGATANVGND